MIALRTCQASVACSRMYLSVVFVCCVDGAGRAEAPLPEAPLPEATLPGNNGFSACNTSRSDEDGPAQGPAAARSRQRLRVLRFAVMTSDSSSAMSALAAKPIPAPLLPLGKHSAAARSLSSLRANAWL